MTKPQVHDEAMSALTCWFNSHRSSPDHEPRTYVICAGLAVLERMRTSHPLARKDFITARNQVRTGGPLIRKILERNGEHRRFTAEGGRTTRATVPAAEGLVKSLNSIEALADLSAKERTQVVNNLQSWLAKRVSAFLNQQAIEIEVNLSKPSTHIVADILAAADTKAGAVAQHLVGAKLAVRFPNLDIANFSYTTADQQLRRPGDFVVSDSVFHVTVAPMPPVFHKCEDNLRNGFRPMLVVPESRLQAARQMADAIEVLDKVGIFSVESFIGQNLEELGGFAKDKLAGCFKSLLAKYNERVKCAEVDRSFLIRLPTNL